MRSPEQGLRAQGKQATGGSGSESDRSQRRQESATLQQESETEQRPEEGK